MADLLSRIVTDLLAGVARDSDELASFSQSPEAKRRLAPATRCQLRITAMDRKLKAARMGVEIEVRRRQLEPGDFVNEFSRKVAEVIADIDTPRLLALRAWIVCKRGYDPAGDGALTALLGMLCPLGWRIEKAGAEGCSDVSRG